MDILVCPFCGNAPQASVDDDDTTWMYCQDCNIKFPAWHWQTRIPDNNLRADLAQCQRERDALAKALRQLLTVLGIDYWLFPDAFNTAKQEAEAALDALDDKE